MENWEKQSNEGVTARVEWLHLTSEPLLAPLFKLSSDLGIKVWLSYEVQDNNFRCLEN